MDKTRESVDKENGFREFVDKGSEKRESMDKVNG